MATATKSDPGMSPNGVRTFDRSHRRLTEALTPTAADSDPHDAYTESVLRLKPGTAYVKIGRCAVPLGGINHRATNCGTYAIINNAPYRIRVRQ